MIAIFRQILIATQTSLTLHVLREMIMVKIEELLTPDEHVTKHQGSVQLAIGEIGMPAGDLYLTNKRLIFLISKGWSLLTSGAGIGSKDLIFSIQDIKSVGKSFGYLKVKTDKEYQFVAGLWTASGWADAIQQAITLNPPLPTPPPPPIPQPQPPQSQMSQPPQQPKRFCPHCGNAVKPEARFCDNCGTKLQ